MLWLVRIMREFGEIPRFNQASAASHGSLTRKGARRVRSPDVRVAGGTDSGQDVEQRQSHHCRRTPTKHDASG
jgi:hypothetical protein